MDIATIIAIIVLLLFVPVLIFILTIWQHVNAAGATDTGPYSNFIEGVFMKNPNKNPMAALSKGMASMFASIPDSLFIGSFVLAILFQSLPLAAIFGSLIELSAIRLVIGNILARIMPSLSVASTADARCKKPGVVFSTMDSAMKAMASKYEIAFPSDTLFILGGLGSYIVTCLYQMKDVLKELGPEWEQRLYISMGLVAFGLLCYCIYQLTFSCTTAGPLFLSLILAIVSGILISFQNASIFGKETINILGLPFLDERVETGAPIYACVGEGSAPSRPPI
jgi:hypothetical protein